MRFIVVFLLFIVGLFLSWSLLVMGQMGAPTAMSQWVYDVYQKKQKIASQIEGEKIIVVAGSNALFGVDSKILSEAFQLPVINYGVNAGVELPSTLFMAQRVINRGDMVIMPLEYPMYSYSGAPGVQMIDFVLSREVDFFSKLTFKEQFYILWHVSIERVFEGYLNAENKPVEVGVYGAHQIDAYGDQIETAVRYRTIEMYRDVTEKHVKDPEMYGATFDQKALGWSYLNTFVKWCKEKDVKVIFMPSTLLRHEIYFKDPKEKIFYEGIADEVRSRGWTYVGNPYDYMYKKEYYFNTDFHLIDSARQRRTKKMLEDLKKMDFHN